MSSNQKVILITGASSGVGQSTARLLSQKGYKIFGTTRNPASAEAIPDVEMMPLDVRSDDSVAACVKAVADEAGRIDVLVNNAAYELAGAIEEISIDEAKAQFETNFFGIVRMVQAILPSMRQHRQGQIINVSSLSGVSSPFMGIYSAQQIRVGRLHGSPTAGSRTAEYSCIADGSRFSQNAHDGQATGINRTA